ncbi:MAG TPA: HNH endonuclease signature motif containing protein [Archangium sp.]|nr:HNH endonuclease signature motif containing protein [Archangium sp.]
MAPATKGDPAKPLGEHAHIIAHSDAGPRADPSIPESERASYSNLILLCPTHHTQVDKQPDSFTVEDLRSWKRDLERWVHERLGRAVSDITFTELEQVCQYLLSPAGTPTSNFQVLPPKEKMDRNGITQRLEGYLRLGIGGSPYVERYVDHVAEIDEDFPERLKAGFLREYRARYEQGERGDVLFASLLRFAQAGDDGLARQAAGLAVLGYLFMTCEVFES